MLETVKKAVDSVDPTQGCICDLFSGSGTVSKYFSQYRNVISSDIQQYSLILCEATMQKLDNSEEASKIVNTIKERYVNSCIRLAFDELLSYESNCINNAKKGRFDALYDIIEQGSIYIYQKGESEAQGNLSTIIKSALNNLDNDKSCLIQDCIITRYFGGLYFSYLQAVQMDCIEKFIFENDGLYKTKLLAALLSTASEVVNTVGKQFAQPLKVRNKNGSYKQSLLKKILEDRSIEVFEVYEKWLAYYLESGEANHSYEYICADYKDTLSMLKGKNVSVVYADPPYTRYHYSRYYHVLETICLRDNPNVSTTFPNGSGGISRAIYREGRHQSPFCIKSQAEAAFDELFNGVKELNVPLVLSYSPFEPSQAVTPRLQTIEQLIEKAKEYFSNVTTMSPGEFTHSKLNSTDKNFETNHEAELLIICKN